MRAVAVEGHRTQTEQEDLVVQAAAGPGAKQAMVQTESQIWEAEAAEEDGMGAAGVQGQGALVS